MATVRILLDTRHKSVDGLYPVVLRISQKSKDVSITTKYRIDIKDWDSKLLIKKGCKSVVSVSSVNSILLDTRNKIEGLIERLTNDGLIQDMTALEIKKIFVNAKRKDRLSFESYTAEFIRNKAVSTIKLYNDTLVIIHKFRPAPILFSDINLRFLRDLEISMKERNNSANYISIHFRNIRAIFNSAINEDMVDPGLYPFRKFKIKSEKTRKRNLSIEYVRLIRSQTLSGVPEIAANIFLLQFYLIGINLKDLTHLKYSNIVDGRLEFRRMKTGTDYSIKLEPEAVSIFEKYRGERLLLNLLEKNYSVYENCRKEINKKLKKVAELCNIPEKISTYYARHSWATIAHSLGYSVDEIAKCLGHADGRVTDIYINFDRELIDRINRRVIDSLY